MLALRLFLPENWTSNQARLKRAARSKSHLAMVENDRAIAAGVRLGCVLIHLNDARIRTAH
jgi:hypothetical protein